MQPPTQPDSEQPQADKPVEAASDAPMTEPSVASAEAEPLPTPTPSPAESAQPMPLGGVGQQGSAGSKPPRNKRLLLIGIIVGAVVLLGGGAAAYLSWYQNPEKVVFDSLMNTMKTEKGSVTGSAVIETDEVDVTIAIDAKGHTDASALKADVKLKLKGGQFANQELTISADTVAIKNGDSYFKVSNIQKAMDSFVDSMIDAYAEEYRKSGMQLTPQDIQQMRTMVKQQFQGVVSKIDGQWIKLSADDLKQSNENDSTTCVLEAFEKIAKDESMTRELYDVYTKNRFLVVKESLGTKDGSFGYLLEINADAAKTFGNDIKNTQFDKELKKCDKDSTTEESTSADDDTKETLKNGRFELWVDEWSHRATRVVFSGESPDSAKSKGKFSGDFKVDYNSQIDEIKAPDNAKSLKEVEADIKSLTGSAGLFSSET